MKVDVPPFVGERGAESVLHVRCVERACDSDHGPLAGCEFGDAFHFAGLAGKIGVGIEIGFLLNQDREIVRFDRDTQLFRISW